VGFFKRRQPDPIAPTPVSRPPAVKTCVCGATLAASEMPAHLDTHIIPVTMAGGHPGRSFDCPLCGPSDTGYGQPGEHPISLTTMSHAFFRKHCKDAHGVEI